MPEISLLQPVIIRELVQKLIVPQEMVLLNTLPRTQWPWPVAQWDVISGSRLVAKPNVPNSEAHIVPRLGISQESASFIYLREKKVFEPTTIHWIREPGQVAGRNAEAAVLREVNDLDVRFNNFAEWTCWQALTGSIVFDYEDIQATVDTKIPSTHKVHPAVGWGTATPAQIRSDVAAWKRLMRRDARVQPRTCFCTEVTLNLLVSRFIDTPLLLSDRMRDQWYQTGNLPGFLGLDWVTVEHTYTTDGGTETLFLADYDLVVCNLNDNRPMEVLEGPSADDEAPSGFTGKFSKTWKEKDPSARQFLLEWNMLPVITRPEQFIFVKDVRSTT